MLWFRLNPRVSDSKSGLLAPGEDRVWGAGRENSKEYHERLVLEPRVRVSAIHA